MSYIGAECEQIEPRADFDLLQLTRTGDTCCRGERHKLIPAGRIIRKHHRTAGSGSDRGASPGY